MKYVLLIIMFMSFNSYGQMSHDTLYDYFMPCTPLVNFNIVCSKDNSHYAIKVSEKGIKNSDQGYIMEEINHFIYPGNHTTYIGYYRRHLGYETAFKTKEEAQQIIINIKESWMRFEESEKKEKDYHTYKDCNQ